MLQNITEPLRCGPQSISKDISCQLHPFFVSLIHHLLYHYSPVLAIPGHNDEVENGAEIYHKGHPVGLLAGNAMVSRYAQNGDYYEGLRNFQRMQDEMCEPNEIALATVLSICATQTEKHNLDLPVFICCSINSQCSPNQRGRSLMIHCLLLKASFLAQHPGSVRSTVLVPNVDKGNFEG